MCTQEHVIDVSSGSQHCHPSQYGESRPVKNVSTPTWARCIDSLLYFTYSHEYKLPSSSKCIIEGRHLFFCINLLITVDQVMTDSRDRRDGEVEDWSGVLEGNGDGSKEVRGVGRCKFCAVLKSGLDSKRN